MRLPHLETHSIMKRVIIFLNGDPPTDKDLSTAAELAHDATIICADGAYDYLGTKITPDILLGDFDSIKCKPELKSTKVITYPVEKDYSDGYIAMQTAIDLGAKEVLVYGAFGGRPDYSYVNLSLLYQAKKAGVKSELLGNGNIVTLESGEIERNVSMGAIISIVPFFNSAHILSSVGLKYMAKDIILNREHADFGVSNVAVDEHVRIEVDGDVLLFIQESE